MFCDLKILKTVAHEFRTPLNTINSIAYLLNNEDLDGSIKKKLNIINTCSEHLSSIIKDLTDYFNNKKSSHETIDRIHLLKLLTKTINSYSYNSNKNSIILDSHVPEVLYGKKNTLNQVINTVINNAVSYTQNGLIKVIVKVISKHANSIILHITVKDSDKGVDKQLRKDIYNTQLIAESQSSSKLNIGLALLKKNIKKCHGEILELPTESASNSFAFELRLNMNKTQLNKETNHRIKTNNCSILVVEDNKLNQKLTQKLIKQKGYLCDTADNGYEALKMLKQKHYSVILMDLMMPIMDGYEATKHINKLDNKPFIIAFTAVAELEEINSLYHKGFDGILRKPFKSKELFETLNSFLTKTSIQEI